MTDDPICKNCEYWNPPTMACMAQTIPVLTAPDHRCHLLPKEAKP